HAATRLERGGILAHRVSAAFDDAIRRTADDANAFVKVVNMGRQPASGAKQSVAAAHFDSGHQRFVEEVDERGALPRLESNGGLEPIHALQSGASRAKRIVRHW